MRSRMREDLRDYRRVSISDIYGIMVGIFWLEIRIKQVRPYLANLM